MGMIYLLYSAYFLSSDFIGMTEFINLVLAFVYFTLGVVNQKALMEQISHVRQFLIQNEEDIPIRFRNNPRSFQEAIKLKYKMLK